MREVPGSTPGQAPRICPDHQKIARNRCLMAVASKGSMISRVLLVKNEDALRKLSSVFLLTLFKSKLLISKEKFHLVV